MRNTIWIVCILFGTEICAQNADIERHNTKDKKYAGISAKQADASMIAKKSNPAELKLKPQTSKTADASLIITTPERAKKRTTAAFINPAPAK